MNILTRFAKESGSGGQKFVMVNAGGDAAGAVALVDADDIRKAADAHFAGESDLLRESEDNFDGAALFGRRVHDEINAAKADVAGVRGGFFHAAVAFEADEQRKREIEAASVAKVCRIRDDKGLQGDAEAAPKVGLQRAGWQSFSAREEGVSLNFGGFLTSKQNELVASCLINC